MSFGARLARNDITTNFAGRHCETLLNGLYYVDGRRHVDHHTRIEHAQPQGVSREYYRGILADTARGVFSGRILVRSEEHTSELQSLMRNSYAVFCLKKKRNESNINTNNTHASGTCTRN